jgi:hypothetical protein
MKIKLFEAFNTEDYYTEITFEEYLNLVGESSQNDDCLLSDEEKLWIKENFPIKQWQTKRKDKTILGTITNEFIFYKLEDDYFLCSLVNSLQPTYYKCDQFEGFKKLLKDKGVI